MSYEAPCNDKRVREWAERINEELRKKERDRDRELISRLKGYADERCYQRRLHRRGGYVEDL